MSTRPIIVCFKIEFNKILHTVELLTVSYSYFQEMLGIWQKIIIPLA